MPFAVFLGLIATVWSTRTVTYIVLQVCEVQVYLTAQMLDIIILG